VPKVMIVDDSLFTRNHLAKLLAEHGYDTVQAENGAQAITMYRAARPDIVLMDITMPHLNGIEALAEIRHLDTQAKVIIFTALNQEQIATRAIHIGAEDFLVKPVPPAKLLVALQKALR